MAQFGSTRPVLVVTRHHRAGWERISLFFATSGWETDAGAGRTWDRHRLTAPLVHALTTAPRLVTRTDQPGPAPTLPTR